MTNPKQVLQKMRNESWSGSPEAAALDAAIAALSQQRAVPEVDTYQSCACGFEDFAGGYERCPECGAPFDAPSPEEK